MGYKLLWWLQDYQMGEKQKTVRYFVTYQYTATMQLLLLTLLPWALQAAQIFSVAAFEAEYPDVNSYRLMVLRSNLQYIERHNADPAQSYKLKGYPQFVGLTPEQISARYFRYADAPEAKDSEVASKPVVLSLGSSYLIDLRRYMNTSVKDQGRFCNNGYAYATADFFDMLLYGKKNGTLSVQQISDCTASLTIPQYSRNSGCYFGRVNNSLDYAMSFGLYANENVYPISFQSLNKGVNQTCRTISSNSASSRLYKLKSWAQLAPNNLNDRATLLANKRPIIAQIAAGSPEFYFYKSGILSNCDDLKLNHAVIMMGFSYNTTWGNYWLVKNSWGELWGEAGYVRIEMASDNSCGLNLRGYLATA